MKQTILVVEDNEQNRYQLQVMLGGNGYEVVTAANGVEALAEARHNLPDLIITDIFMPEMDGFALCREWKKDKVLRSIPLIFYTATYVEERDREFALSLGAARFLIKPEEPEVFLQAVREVIEQARRAPVAPPDGAGEPSSEEAGYLKQYNEMLIRKLEAKMQQLEQINRKLEQGLAERERVERTLRFTNLVLSTQQDTALDGILVVDGESRILSYNRRFIEMWGVPAKLVEGREDEPLLEFVADQVIDLQPFLRRVQYLYEHKQESSRDDIILKDGRVFDRYSAPMFGVDEKYYGRVWYFRDITENKQAEEEREKNVERLRKMSRGVIYTISKIGEIRDPYTAGHEQRVARVASAIAVELGMPADQVEGISIAGILHDVGKIAVPTEILSKPGRLNEYEFSMIKTHPLVGYQILKEIEFPHNWPVGLCALQHQERMNGSGYPEGLTGENIIREARIIAVADVVEAMSSHRPYRPALGVEKALEEITRNKGVLYDPEVVDACLKIFENGFKLD